MKELKKKIEYLRINLTIEVKKLYAEDCKTLMTEVEKDTNMCKDIMCSWIRRVAIMEMSILPKTFYQCNPYQHFNVIFREIEKTILRFVCSPWQP